MAIENDERRGHTRHEEPVCTWLEFGEEHAAYSTVASDVGQGGARLSAQHPIRKGDHIRLSLQLEGGR